MIACIAIDRVFNLVVSSKYATVLNRTETKTCKNGSRDQVSSLENSKSGRKCLVSLYIASCCCWLTFLRVKLLIVLPSAHNDLVFNFVAVVTVSVPQF